MVHPPDLEIRGGIANHPRDIASPVLAPTATITYSFVQKIGGPMPVAPKSCTNDKPTWITPKLQLLVSLDEADAGKGNQPVEGSSTTIGEGATFYYGPNS